MAALACGPRSTDLRHGFRATFRSIPRRVGMARTPLGPAFGGRRPRAWNAKLPILERATCNGARDLRTMTVPMPDG